VESDEAVIERLCYAILEYLIAHTDAADTARGIANWWLPATDRGVDAQVLLAALERLVARRQLSKHLLVDGSVLYTHRDVPMAGARPGNGVDPGAACKTGYTR
jgi:hypothetical protein